MILVNLQALRVLFTLLIVTAHLTAVYDVVGLGAFSYAFTHIGSDGFIAVTAFLMAYGHALRPKSPLQYLVGRLRRLAPLYWLITLVVAALAVAAPGLFQSTVVTPETLLKSLFFIPYDKHDGVLHPLVFVGWTMNLFAFHIVIASVLIAVAGRHAGMATAIVLAGLAILGFVFHPTDPMLAFWTQPRLLSLAAGQILCEWWLKYRMKPPPRWRSLWFAPRCLAAAAFLFGMCALRDVLFSDDSIGPPVVAPVFASAFGALTIVPVLMLDRAGYVIRSKFLDTLANASFSTYLTHYFVTQAAAMAVVLFGVTDPFVIAGLLITAYVGAMALGVITSNTVERALGTIVRWKPSRARQPSRTASPN